MAQYFFHLRDGADVLLDVEGREFDGVEAAAAQALREARSLISHDALEGRIDLRQRIDVETEDGTIVHRLNFEDALVIARGR